MDLCKYSKMPATIGEMRNVALIEVEMPIGMEIATPKGRLGQLRNESRRNAPRSGCAALANDEGQMRSGVDVAPLPKPCALVVFRPGIPITL